MMARMDTLPRQKLVFFVAQDIDAASTHAVNELISQLSISRDWLLGAPRLVDASDGQGPGERDLPVQTLGGELEIYSALGPTPIPKNVDAVHFSEVSALIDAVKRASKDYGLAFEFELDGTFVGSIEDGKIDKILQSGLLDPWREHLDR